MTAEAQRKFLLRVLEAMTRPTTSERQYALHAVGERLVLNFEKWSEQDAERMVAGLELRPATNVGKTKTMWG
jgi:hypothetical protein